MNWSRKTTPSGVSPPKRPGKRKFLFIWLPSFLLASPSVRLSHVLGSHYHSRESFGKREHQLRKCSYLNGLWAGLCVLSWLMIDVCMWGVGLLIEGGTTPRLGVPGSLREQAEQTGRSKPVGITPPWPLPQFLPGVLVLTFLSDRVTQEL